jgi:hypothetical protein
LLNNKLKLNMKKLALTFAIVLGISMCSFAQLGGGLFQYGEVSDEEYYYGTAWYALNQNYEFQNQKVGGLFAPGIPVHGQDDNMDAPLGSGALLLIGFGAAYALKKRNKK